MSHTPETCVAFGCPLDQPELLPKGHTVRCDRCRRPWAHWPLKRSATCAPANWKTCIRPVRVAA